MIERSCYKYMRTKAIIIKKQNTNEYDQLITCYTKEFGKITAIAKSILKHSSVQAMHLDVLNLVEFDLISGRATPIITGAQCINSHRQIKQSLPALASAQFFMEVLDKIVMDGEKDASLWEFLIGILEKLKSNTSNPLPVLRNGQAELLKLLGYFPIIDRCVLCYLEMRPEGGCEDTEGWSLSLEMGGILCKNCFLSGLRGMLLKTADWLYLTLSDVHELPAEPRRSVLDGLFEYTFDTKLKSLDFLYSSLNYKIR